MGTAMTHTTLSAAVTASADSVSLTSATGVSSGTILFIDREFMVVTSISGTVAKVDRSRMAGIQSGHASGAKVLLADPEDGYFIGYDKAGYEASPAKYPLVNIHTGEIFQNFNGAWLGSYKNGIDAANDVWIFAGAGAPTDGTTGDNAAGPGSLYVDRANGVKYINVNTAAAPVWVAVASQST